MPIVARPRPHHLVTAIALAVVVAVAGAVPAPAHAGDPLRTPKRPAGLEAFMDALAAVESGGRYKARNPTSGAYGRYQIMPANWPSWARIYIGNRNAKPTPANQDRVAAGKLSDLHRAYGSWSRVAYVWLTGSRGPRSTWSSFANRYVNRVMRGYRNRLGSPDGDRRVRVLDDRNPAITWDGTWIRAGHEAYSGDRARASRDRGARMKLQFTGRSVALVGPVGPTRGRAAVYVDGKRVRVIDLRAGRFDPRRTLFQKRWRSPGTHTVELVVLGTKGRPHVAIDQIVVRR